MLTACKVVKRSSQDFKQTDLMFIQSGYWRENELETTSLRSPRQQPVAVMNALTM